MRQKPFRALAGALLTIALAGVAQARRHWQHTDARSDVTSDRQHVVDADGVPDTWWLPAGPGPTIGAHASRT